MYSRFIFTPCLLWLVQKPWKSMGDFSTNFQVACDQTCSVKYVLYRSTYWSGYLCPKRIELHQEGMYLVYLCHKSCRHLHWQWDVSRHLSSSQFSLLDGDHSLLWSRTLSYTGGKLCLGMSHNQHEPDQFTERENLLQLKDCSYATTVSACAGRSGNGPGITLTVREGMCWVRNSMQIQAWGPSSLNWFCVSQLQHRRSHCMGISVLVPASTSVDLGREPPWSYMWSQPCLPHPAFG